LNWSCEKDDPIGIYYCFDFNGFCKEVVGYYQTAFHTEVNIKHYENSDKGLAAILKCKESNQTYALKVKDDLESAEHQLNSYNPNALLFYKAMYNPVLNVKATDYEMLAQSFNKLSEEAKLNKPIAIEAGHVRGSLIDKYGICWNVMNG
jgi:uncharacterized glyoxalase superfamily protein PhnB